jgi:hypothetical protein
MMKAKNTMQAALLRAGVIGQTEIDRAHEIEELKSERRMLYNRINSCDFQLGFAVTREWKQELQRVKEAAEDRIAEIGREIGKGIV